MYITVCEKMFHIQNNIHYNFCVQGQGLNLDPEHTLLHLKSNYPDGSVQCVCVWLLYPALEGQKTKVKNIYINNVFIINRAEVATQI